MKHFCPTCLGFRAVFENQRDVVCATCATIITTLAPDRVKLVSLFGEWFLMMLLFAGAGRLYHITIETALAVILATAYVVARHYGRSLAWQLFCIYVDIRARLDLRNRLDDLYWLMRRSYAALRRVFPRWRRQPAGPQVIFSVPTGEFRTLLVRCPACKMLQLAWVLRTVDGFALQCENCGEVASSL